MKYGNLSYMQAQGEMTPLRELKRPQPMVFAGVYPFDGGEHAKLKSAIEKVCLNDFSVTLTTESSMAMGLGWRVGFLGLLHMEVRQASFLNITFDPNVKWLRLLVGFFAAAGRRI